MTAPPPLHKALIAESELHYVEAGSGPLLVFVHGTLGDYRTWKRQLSFFSKHFHAVAYSRRYHFPNPWPPAGISEEYSAERHASDLAELIRMFRGQPAHVVTASWGGNAALQLALTRPGLVRTIVLAEPPVLPLLANNPGTKHLLDEFSRTSLIPARIALQKGEWDEGVRYFIDGVMGPGAYDAMPKNVHRYFLDNAKELLAETLSHNYIPNFTPGELSKITAPVLLLEGERSPEMFHAIIDILAACLPAASRSQISDASHGMHSDNAQDYNKRVLDFLLLH